MTTQAQRTAPGVTARRPPKPEMLLNIAEFLGNTGKHPEKEERCKTILTRKRLDYIWELWYHDTEYILCYGDAIPFFRNPVKQKRWIPGAKYSRSNRAA